MQIYALLLMVLISSLCNPANADDRDGAHEHGLIIDQPWVRQTGNRTISAAIYLAISNDGPFLEKLIDVRTDKAERIQIHQSFSENGIARMRHIPDLPIAPNERLAFKPGGYHIMLTRLAAPLRENDVFPVTLVFEKAGEVTVQVLVTGIAGLDASD